MADSVNTYCHSVLGGYEGMWKEQSTWSEENSWAPSSVSEEWSSIPQVELQDRPQTELLVCKTDNLKYIERLLILGTGQQNKYKSGVSKISSEDLLLVQKEIDSPNCYKLLELVADIYLKGRAFKQDMTMQVLALICRCKTNVTLRRDGYALVGKLRTLSQLYLFLGFYAGGTQSATHAPIKGKKCGKKTDTISLTTEATLPVLGGPGGLPPTLKGSVALSKPLSTGLFSRKRLPNSPIR